MGEKICARCEIRTPDPQALTRHQFRMVYKLLQLKRHVRRFSHTYREPAVELGSSVAIGVGIGVGVNYAFKGGSIEKYDL